MEKSAISEIQQAANASIKTETGTSSENENQDERLVSSFRKMFEELEPPVSNKGRMYKVPYQLRTLNPKAYTPHVLSIGPYHHNNENCRTMEKHKVRYFQSFMERVDTKVLKMENLVSTIREMENEIRSCYVETVQLKSDVFVKMILLDASFILELFMRKWGNGFKYDDPIAVEGWLWNMVFHELLLLENQLPFFVIEKLYHLVLPSLSNPTPLIQLTFHFFKSLNIHKKSPDVKIQHFTDLLRFFQLPPTNKLPRRTPYLIFPKYSVTQLHEAGVRFKVASSKCVLDEVALSIRDEKPSSKCVLDEVALSIRDEKPSSKCVLDLKFKRGVLEIPLLEFQDDTETLVQNIIALEQCDDTRGAYITDFYFILDRLINSTKDVDLLGDEGILINGLGDNIAVTSMIHNLNRGIFYANMNSGFCQLSEDLNKYYEQSWHRWKAILKKQYPNMAILGLVLTLIQTVLSIHQVLP